MHNASTRFLIVPGSARTNYRRGSARARLRHGKKKEILHTIGGGDLLPHRLGGGSGGGLLPQRWRMGWRQPPSQRLRRRPPSEWRRPRSPTATDSSPNRDGARRPPSPSAAAAVAAASFPNGGGGGGGGLLPNGAGLVPQRYTDLWRPYLVVYVAKRMY